MRRWQVASSKWQMIFTHHASRISQRPGLIAGLLFIATLLPRLPGLNRFLTSDENTNIFLAGSDVIAAFLRGDFRGTYWHFYPGVTMSWLDAIGMAGQYGLDLLSGKSVPPFIEYIYADILSLVVANRLPYAILTAIAVPGTYLLARKLLPNRAALLGALFMAFDPFYLAHSRVAHGDAPVAVFMSLSTLTFFIFAAQTEGRATENLTIKQQLYHTISNRYLIASAILGGLAGLTKAPGPFMALFVIGMAIIYAGLDLRATRDASGIITRWLIVIAAWGFISLAVFILLWPSLWVDPGGTLRQMWAETFGKVNEGHLVYFFGKPTLDPGPWFYLYVIPFRLTPVILTGSLLSLLCFAPNRHSRCASLLTRHSSPYPSPVLLLWLFTLTLLLFGNLSPKKQDRYLLPLFPFLNLIAAIGWLAFFHLLYNLITSQFAKTQSPISQSPISNPSTLLRTSLQSPITTLLILVLLLLHLTPTLTYYPYYLAYFNPLMGGPIRAAETTLMGWGEGMEQAAAYLNTKPKAKELYVASTPSQTLLPYFVGRGENFYTNDIAFRADYVVLYVAQIQRLAPSPEIVHYFETQTPEKVITIHGVPYAKIYPGPKFILSGVPADAAPVNIGLEDKIRLAGYKISSGPTLQRRSNQTSNHQPPITNHQLPLTLYWHTLAPLSANYTISVRALAADGQRLTQQDNWPVAGLLPTSQWRQGDYIADTHTLELAEADFARLDQLEIVVYNAAAGQTLGPPISLPLIEAKGE